MSDNLEKIKKSKLKDLVPSNEEFTRRQKLDHIFSKYKGEELKEVTWKWSESYRKGINYLVGIFYIGILGVVLLMLFSSASDIEDVRDVWRERVNSLGTSLCTELYEENYVGTEVWDNDLIVYCENNRITVPRIQEIEK